MIPYALPFERPYVTARGTLERRELLLRAPPDRRRARRPRRGGAAVAAGRRRSPRSSAIAGELDAAPAPSSDVALMARAAARRRDRRVDPRRGRAAAPAPAMAARRHRALRPRRQASGTAAVAAARRGRDAGAGALQRDARRRRADEVAAEAPSAGPSAASRPSSSRSASAATSSRCARCATRSAPTRASGSTPTAPGAPTRRVERLRRCRAARDRARRAAGRDLEEMAAVPRATDVPIAADESVDERQGRASGRARGRLRPGDGEAREGRRDRRGARIAAELPVYLSSALDGPVGIAAAAHAAQALYRRRRDAGVAHGLATQLLFADTIAARECALDERLSLPDGPGPRRRDRRARARARTGS